MKPNGRTLLLALIVGTWLFCAYDLKASGDVDTQAYQVSLRRVEELTGKNFRREVPIESQTRDGFQGFLATQLDKQFPRNELRNIGNVYSLIGLIPTTFQLSEQLPKLYREQTGAYYDPESGQIFQLPGTFSSAEKQFLYVHEAVHALQDQYYNIEKMHQERLENSTLDQQLALAFVLEGHANLVATASLMNATALDSSFFNNDRFQMIFEMTSRLTDLSSEQFQAITKIFGGESTSVGRSLQKLRGVPIMLIQQMADPYFVGQDLWFQRFKHKKSDIVRKWLRNPPTTTAEIFYEVEFQDGFTESPGLDGPVYRNSLGVYVILRWLEVFRQRPSWGGKIESDQVFLLQTEEKRDTALVWQIQFRDEESLRAFGGTLNRRLEPRNSLSRGYIFHREGQKRYLWTAVDERKMVIVVDDDPDPADELSSAPGLSKAAGLSVNFHKENVSE